MRSIENSMFPNGVPLLLNKTQMCKLLGITRNSLEAIMEQHPEMYIDVDGIKRQYISSKLYFELANQKSAEQPTN